MKNLLRQQHTLSTDLAIQAISRNSDGINAFSYSIVDCLSITLDTTKTIFQRGDCAIPTKTLGNLWMSVLEQSWECSITVVII